MRHRLLLLGGLVAVLSLASALPAGANGSNIGVPLPPDVPVNPGPGRPGGGTPTHELVCIPNSPSSILVPIGRRPPSNPSFRDIHYPIDPRCLWEVRTGTPRRENGTGGFSCSTGTEVWRLYYHTDAQGRPNRALPAYVTVSRVDHTPNCQDPNAPGGYHVPSQALPLLGVNNEVFTQFPHTFDAVPREFLSRISYGRYPDVAVLLTNPARDFPTPPTPERWATHPLSTLYDRYTTPFHAAERLVPPFGYGADTDTRAVIRPSLRPSTATFERFLTEAWWARAANLAVPAVSTPYNLAPYSGWHRHWFVPANAPYHAYAHGPARSCRDFRSSQREVADVFALYGRRPGQPGVQVFGSFRGAHQEALDEPVERAMNQTFWRFSNEPDVFGRAPSWPLLSDILNGRLNHPAAEPFQHPVPSRGGTARHPDRRFEYGDPWACNSDLEFAETYPDEQARARDTSIRTYGVCVVPVRRNLSGFLVQDRAGYRWRIYTEDARRHPSETYLSGARPGLVSGPNRFEADLIAAEIAQRAGNDNLSLVHAGNMLNPFYGRRLFDAPAPVDRLTSWVDQNVTCTRATSAALTVPSEAQTSRVIELSGLELPVPARLYAADSGAAGPLRLDQSLLNTRDLRLTCRDSDGRQVSCPASLRSSLNIRVTDWRVTPPREYPGTWSLRRIGPGTAELQFSTATWRGQPFHVRPVFEITYRPVSDARLRLSLSCDVLVTGPIRLGGSGPCPAGGRIDLTGSGIRVPGPPLGPRSFPSDQVRFTGGDPSRGIQVTVLAPRNFSPRR